MYLLDIEIQYLEIHLHTRNEIWSKDLEDYLEDLGMVALGDNLQIGQILLVHHLDILIILKTFQGQEDQEDKWDSIQISLII